jgi:hypothetical protein
MESIEMDFLFLGIIAVFILLSLAFIAACRWLTGPPK